jgi:arabinan endo-1,5-alpha-L-arabinosidase
VGQVFGAGNRPSLDGRTDGGLWAPDIAKVGNKYVLYYAYYSTKGEWSWGIGAATADKLTGPWVNIGKIFIGGEVGVQCSIDPCFYSENGRNYLFWGSYYGIWAIELTADGLAVKPDAEKVRVAGVDGYGLEAAMIHKRNGQYFLFVSEGGTGYKEHYKVGAARADNLLGPYVNKAGQNVVGGAVDFFMKEGDGFISPGHSSQVITDKNGQDWFLHHAFVKNEEDKSRRLMLTKLDWTADGWPTVEDGVPARECTTLPSF